MRFMRHGPESGSDEEAARLGLAQDAAYNFLKPGERGALKRFINYCELLILGSKRVYKTDELSSEQVEEVARIAFEIPGSEGAFIKFQRIASWILRAGRDD